MSGDWSSGGIREQRDRFNQGTGVYLLTVVRPAGSVQDIPLTKADAARLATDAVAALVAMTKGDSR